MTSINQYEVAKLAGVSQATVSRVLHNSPRVSDATREKVMGAMEQLGYRLNVVASELAQSRKRPAATTTLACIVGHTDGNPMGRVLAYQQIYAGLQQRAHQLSFQVELFWRYHPDLHGVKLEQTLWNRGIRGVMLLGINEDEVNLQWDRYAVAYASAGAPQNERRSFSSPARSNCDIIALALKRCFHAGRRKVALLLGLEMDQHMGHQEAAIYEHAMGIAGLPAQVFIATEPDSYDQLVAQIQASAVDAVISNSHSTTFRARMDERDLRIPEDVAFIHTDIIEGGPEDEASGFVVPYHGHGMASVDLIVGAMSRNEYGYPAYRKSVILDFHWTPGTTFPNKP